MFLACSRFIFLFTFLASVLVMGAAFYLEYGSGLEPCSLCWVQRFFLLAFAAVNLMAYLHSPKRRGVLCYALVSLLFVVGGAASAVRQVSLQRLPPEQLMFCQPDLACMWHTLSIGEWVATLYRGNESCALVSWTVFGLSVAELSLLAFTGLGVLSVVQIVRSILGDKPAAPAT